MSAIAGLFNNKEDAARAFNLVLGFGYHPSDINVLMSQATYERNFSVNSAETRTPQTALLNERADAGNGDTVADTLGGPIGGTIGTFAPVFAAVGVALIPGIGIAAGPFAIALAAAGTAGVATGILGILANWGIPRDQVKEYEAGIDAGGILLGVKAKSAEDGRKIRRRWREEGGVHISS